VQGVEFDVLGKRSAYWLFREHPGAATSYGGVSARIPASEILHIYLPGRPGQVRAISWFAPVLLRFKDFDEFEDATLMKQKVAACLAVLVTDVDGANTALGTTTTDDPMVDTLSPGMIANIPPGRSVDVVAPPQSADYPTYASTVLRAIATGIGVSYEDLTGDYTNLPLGAGRRLALARDHPAILRSGVAVGDGGRDDGPGHRGPVRALDSAADANDRARQGRARDHAQRTRRHPHDAGGDPRAWLRSGRGAGRGRRVERQARQGRRGSRQRCAEDDAGGPSAVRGRIVSVLAARVRWSHGMISSAELDNRATLTPRQAEAVQLIDRYVQAAEEPPSSAWLGRRLGISREAARDLMARLRERQGGRLTQSAFR
jgi:hypothetical protein